MLGQKLIVANEWLAKQKVAFDEASKRKDRVKSVYLDAIDAVLVLKDRIRIQSALLCPPNTALVAPAVAKPTVADPVVPQDWSTKAASANADLDDLP